MFITLPEDTLIGLYQHKNSKEMKFSKLEQEVIINLCGWAREPNVFKATRNFLSEKGLRKGTGLFSFSKEIENRPQAILCIDMNEHNYEKYDEIYNNTLFVLYFLRKLERLGLVTISEGKYPNNQNNEYAIATFTDASIPIVSTTSSKTQWSYSFKYVKKGNSAIDLEIIEEGLTIRRTDNQCALSFYNVELFSRFETFDLVSSNIALEQELFELVNNEFKTNEELMLEKAEQQLCTANKIFEKTQILANKAIENIELSKEQFETAQRDSIEQFEKAQHNASERFETELKNSRKQYEESRVESIRQYEESRKESIRQYEESREESKRQFKKANCKSIWALVLALISILLSPIIAKYVPTTIDNNQYNHIDSIKTEEIQLLQDINAHTVALDTIRIKKSNKIN